MNKQLLQDMAKELQSHTARMICYDVLLIISKQDMNKSTVDFKNGITREIEQYMNSKFPLEV